MWHAQDMVLSDVFNNLSNDQNNCKQKVKKTMFRGGMNKMNKNKGLQQDKPCSCSCFFLSDLGYGLCTTALKLLSVLYGLVGRAAEVADRCLRYFFVPEIYAPKNWWKKSYSHFMYLKTIDPYNTFNPFSMCDNWYFVVFKTKSVKRRCWGSSSLTRHA